MARRGSGYVEEGHLLPKNTDKLYLKVLEAWERGDFPVFAKNITSDIFKHYYTGCSNLRLLDLIVYESPCKMEFLEKALELKPNLNEYNLKMGYATIHFAFRNLDVVWRLLHAGADPNLQDRDGDTILHYIMNAYVQDPKKFFNFFQKWMKVPNLAVNVPNMIGRTPIAQAMKKCCYVIVTELLKLGSAIDLDTFWEKGCNLTAREVMIKLVKIPELTEQMPKEPWKADPQRGINDYKYRLFYFLTNQHGGYQLGRLFRDVFPEALTAPTINRQELLTCVDAEGKTYLQQAARFSQTKCVKILVENGADVNYAPPGTLPPIFYAAMSKKLDGFNYLLSHKDIKIEPNCNKETILHVWVKSQDSMLLNNDALKAVLRLKDLNINAKDCHGQTALHLAVTNANEQTIFELLDAGLRLDAEDEKGETPFSHLSRETYENYLNTKITENNEVPQDRNYTISFDYKFMMSRNGTHHIRDINTETLKKIYQSKVHQNLLAHPVIAAIIFYKWKRIQWMYYFYLLAAGIFSVAITVVICLGPQISCEGNCLRQAFFSDVELCLHFYLMVRLLFEAVDFWSGWKQYVRLFENYLQVSMVMLSFVCLLHDCPKNPENWRHCRGVSAYVLLFVWFEMFLIIGRHYKTSYLLDMFREATWFLLRFLGVHAPLLLAFVFSFYVIFKKPDGPFQSVPQAFFKTVIMLTGEYDVSDIPFDALPITSHFLFILFLFLVAIVLFNLLIGLAVSATKPIEDDTFLYSCKAQIPIIIFLEKNFFGDSLFRRMQIFLFRRMQKFLFPVNRDPKIPKDPGYPQLVIYPNENKQDIKSILKTLSEDSAEQGWKRYKDDPVISTSDDLSNRIIQDAKKIVKRRVATPAALEEKIDKLQRKINGHETLFKELMNALQNMQTSIAMEDGIKQNHN